MTVPEFLPGETLPASKLQLLGTLPETYTPQLTAATTSPTLGSGSSAQGTWTQHGPLIVYQFSIKFGTSGVNAGSGQYRVSLPVAVDPGSLLKVAMGFGRIDDISDTTSVGDRLIVLEPAAGLTDRVALAVEGAGYVTNNAPWVWAANDLIYGQAIYQGAL